MRRNTWLAPGAMVAAAASAAADSFLMPASSCAKLTVYCRAWLGLRAGSGALLLTMFSCNPGNALKVLWTAEAQGPVTI